MFQYNKVSNAIPNVTHFSIQYTFIMGHIENKSENYKLFVFENKQVWQL